MLKENSGPEAHGLDAVQPQTPSLTELLSVSSDEKLAASTASNGKAHEAEPELRVESEGESATDEVDQRHEGSSAAAASSISSAIVSHEAAADPGPRHEPRKPKPIHYAFAIAGLCLAALGALLVAAPMVSTSAAQWLANHVALRAQSGTLLISGLCVFMVSILLRAMRDMRCTLDEVSAESQRLEGIAAGGKRVFETLDQVRIEHMVLSREVVHLQTKLRRLIDIVSNPDYTASMYRLAASVDQLGKEVDSSTKGRFNELQQQLAAMSTHAELAKQQVSADLARIPSLMKEHHDAQQQFVKKGFDRQQSGAEDLEALVEKNLCAATRIEEAIQGQQQASLESYASLLESSKAGAQALASSLNELRDHLDRTIAEHAEIVRTEFSHLDTRLDMGERSQPTGMGQLSEQLRQQFADHTEDLHQGLNTIAELGGSNSRLVKQELGVLVQRLEQHAQDQTACLQDAREQAVVATASARNEITAQIGQIEQRIEALRQMHSESQQESSAMTQQAAQSTQREIAAKLSQLESLVEQKALDQRALLDQSALAARSAVDAAGRELAASLAALGVQLDLANSEQREGIRRTAQESNEANQAARRELAESLEQIETTLASQLRGQQQFVLESSLGMQQTADVSKRELVASIEQIGARIEQALEARSTELANDMLEIAVVFDTFSDEVRACIAESVGRAAAPQPGPADEVASLATPASADEVASLTAAEPALEFEPTADAPPALSQPAESSAAPQAPRDYQTPSDRDWPIEWTQPPLETDPYVDPWSEDPT